MNISYKRKKKNIKNRYTRHLAVYLHIDGIFFSDLPEFFKHIVIFIKCQTKFKIIIITIYNLIIYIYMYTWHTHVFMDKINKYTPRLVLACAFARYRLL